MQHWINQPVGANIQHTIEYTERNDRDEYRGQEVTGRQDLRLRVLRSLILEKTPRERDPESPGQFQARSDYGERLSPVIG